MDASKLKHPDKQRLDQVEGIATEFGAALAQAGIGIGETLCEGEMHVFRSDLPPDSSIGVEWYFVAETDEYAQACIDVLFRGAACTDDESIFRFGWTEDDGYFVELDTAGDKVLLRTEALELAGPFGLTQRGDRALVPVGEEGTALARVIEFLRLRTAVATAQS